MIFSVVTPVGQVQFKQDTLESQYNTVPNMQTTINTWHCKNSHPWIHQAPHRNDINIKNLFKALQRRTHPAAAAQAPVLAPLESACTVSTAHIGFNAHGFRGLIASRDLKPGDVAVSVPLHNILQVPRKLGTAAAAEAAAAALSRWQQHHGTLPQPLQELIMDPSCPWEAKLVFWLLHLKQSAAPGTLWNSYCQALPSALDTLTFFCYSEQQAEQLQLSSWKAVAASQRKLLLEVQQQCAKVYGSSSSSSSASIPSAHEIAWALSMVKSRTFGRTLQQQNPTNPGTSESQATEAGASQTTVTQQRLEADAEPLNQRKPSNVYELEPSAGSDDVDESAVVLLMVPFVDMINHAQEQHNCIFGVNWDTQSFEITCSSSIPASQEVTISYGSNKSNLALQSCYGFYIPGNPNDAQLLQPIFRGCLAAAGNIHGFDAALVEAAVADLREGQQQDSLQLARRKCAAAALPVEALDGSTSDGSSSSSLLISSKERLQLQKYMAELILYQIQQILKLCGTTAEEDAAALQELHNNMASTGDMCTSQEAAVAAAVDQAVVAARLEQKRLLLECRDICQSVLDMIILQL